jgi:hypothetical protein
MHAFQSLVQPSAALEAQESQQLPVPPGQNESGNPRVFLVQQRLGQGTDSACDRAFGCSTPTTTSSQSLPDVSLAARAGDYALSQAAKLPAPVLAALIESSPDRLLRWAQNFFPHMKNATSTDLLRLLRKDPVESTYERSPRPPLDEFLKGATGISITPTERSRGVPDHVPFRPFSGAPSIEHDNGVWPTTSKFGNLVEGPCKTPTDNDRNLVDLWRKAVEVVRHLRPDLKDANAAYGRYLDNTGRQLDFSYADFIDEDRGGWLVFIHAVVDTRRAAIDTFDQYLQATYRDRLPKRETKRFHLQTDAILVGKGSRFPMPYTENWRKAIGGHTIWIEAIVSASLDGEKRDFDVEMKIHAEDRYNFNYATELTGEDFRTGIPDSMNQQLQSTCLAKQFDRKAEFTRKFSFTT